MGRHRQSGLLGETRFAQGGNSRKAPAKGTQEEAFTSRTKGEGTQPLGIFSELSALGVVSVAMEAQACTQEWENTFPGSDKPSQTINRKSRQCIRPNKQRNFSEKKKKKKKKKS